MTITLQRAKRVGGSLMVRIPKEIVDLEGISAGEMIEVDIKKAKKDWFGISPGLKPWSKETDRMKFRYE